MESKPLMFDGKKYKLHFLYQTKKEAKRWAGILRRDGDLVRIVSRKAGWALYYRKK